MSNGNIPAAQPNISPAVLSLLAQCLQSGVLTAPANSVPDNPVPTQHASVDDFPLDPQLRGALGGASTVPEDRGEVVQLQERVETLGEEVSALRKRLEEQDNNTRRKKKYKLSISLEDLTEGQKLAREDVMRNCRRTLKALTGRSRERITGEDVLECDFSSTASESPNQEVIQRAVNLTADDYKDSDGRLTYETEELTIEDLRQFITRTFNGWRNESSTKKSATKTKKKEKNQKRNRRYARQLAVSEHLKIARDKYDEKNNCTLPDDIFDPRYMTPYHSELDTTDVSAGELSESDEEQSSEEAPSSGNTEGASIRLTPRQKKVSLAKVEHYGRMAKKANLSTADEAANMPVWEKRPQKFKSRKYKRILAELHELASSSRPKKKGRGKIRALVPKVNFGREVSCPPNGKNPIPSFMVDKQWLTEYEAEGNRLETATNPAGFCDDD